MTDGSYEVVKTSTRMQLQPILHDVTDGSDAHHTIAPQSLPLIPECSSPFRSSHIAHKWSAHGGDGRLALVKA